jgi:hypothetical protein
MTTDRASKLLVTAWAVVALLVECYYAAPGWNDLRWIGPAILLGTAFLAAKDSRAVVCVAPVPYIFPALLWMTTGRYHVHHTTAWLAGVLGIVLPEAMTSGWQVPKPWRAALLTWAGVVCATAPIVVLRAVDFRWELLTRTRQPQEALGGLTYLTIGWILHVALVLVVGILWFDWLCAKREAFLRRWVIAPLAVSVLVLAAVSVYQMFVDNTVLNATVFGVMGRASGTVFDANVAGALGAMWIGGWALLSRRSTGRWWIASVPVVMLWLTVWASSSRTALASAALVSLFVIAQLASRLLSSGKAIVLTVFLTVVGTATVAHYAPRVTVVGPIARLRAGIPAFTPAGLTALARSLWDRDAYGAAAHRIIAAFPLFGIGVGSFHDVAPQFGATNSPDNAQNWPIHQVAELGFVGSLGWIVFVVSFAWWLFRVRSSDPPEAWCARGMLLSFALVSLVGMPGQDPAVALTFWTVAAWCVLMMEPPRVTAPVPARSWAIAALVVALSAVGTAWYAAGRLRTPVRIQHAEGGWFEEYFYGFWEPESDASGEFRWARQEATAVFAAKGRVLDLSTSASDPDLASRPKHVKAWVDGRLVIDTQLTGDRPTVTMPVTLSAGERRVFIETWTDRSFTPPTPDTRDLALIVRWRFH